MLGEVEFRLFAGCEVNPLLLVVQADLGDQELEGVDEHSENLLAVGADPLGHADAGLGVSDGLPSEELPFVLVEEEREHTFDKVHAVGKAVSLEQRPAYLAVAEPDEAVRKHLELLLGAGCLGLGVEGPVEEFDEGGQRELVHVVHLDQVAENHKQVGADVGKVAVHLALLVQRNLKLLRLAERLLNGGGLDFGLVETVN